MPRLYSDAETAQCLQVSIATVRRKRRSRELGYVTIGRKVFTTEDQIKELIRRGRRDVTTSVSEVEGDKQLAQSATLRPTGKRSRIKTDLHSDSGALKRAYTLADLTYDMNAFARSLEADVRQDPDRDLVPKTARR
jgi:hypothetical protein